jgi:hypothetical protein
MLGEGLNRLGMAAKNVAYTSASAAQAAANKISETGIMNEVQDISAKGWDLLGTVYQKAKEQIVGADGNEVQSLYGYGNASNTGLGYPNSSSPNAISWNDPRSPSSPPTSAFSSSSSRGSSSKSKEPEYDDWLEEKPKSSVRKSNDGERSERRERPDRERSERSDRRERPDRERSERSEKSRKEKPELKASDEGSWEGWGDEVVPEKKEDKQEKQQQEKRQEKSQEEEPKENDGDDWVWQEETTPKKKSAASVKQTSAASSTTTPKKTAVSTGGDTWDGWD